MGAGGSIQIDFKTADGKAVRTATVKSKGNETETLPLYTNKDTITGQVCLLATSNRQLVVFLSREGVKVTNLPLGRSGEGQ